MKRYLLFSLCAVTPLLVHSSNRGVEFENEDSDLLSEAIEELMDEQINDELVTGKKIREQNAKNSLVGASDQNGNDANAMASGISSKEMRPPSFQLPVNQSGVFSRAEFLYWKLDQAGNDYVIHKKEGTTALVADNELVLSCPTGSGGAAVCTFPLEPLTGMFGKVHAVNFKWNPGFRVALGYRFARDLWELSGVYTYYYTESSDHVKAEHFYGDNHAASFPQAEVLSPTFDVALDTVILAKAHGHFWYHIGDIELARQFCLTPMISMGFVVGPTVAFIKQRIHLTFADNFFTDMGPSGIATPSQFSFIHLDWNYDGGGVKLGVDSRWNLGGGFNLQFGGALSSVYGIYTNSLKQVRQASTVTVPIGSPPSTGGTASDVTITTGRVAFATRLLGGLEWNKAFRSFNLEAYVNYELNTWFNLTDQYRPRFSNQVTPTLRDFQDAPLNLQGITAGIGINF